MNEQIDMSRTPPDTSIPDAIAERFLFRGTFTRVRGIWRAAVLTPDRVHRLELWRAWGFGPTMAVVGVNPSTADELGDDATIARCIGFARREGCGSLCMLNLLTVRARDPSMLDILATRGPLVVAGARARRRFLLATADIRVAGWGNNGAGYVDEKDDVWTAGSWLVFGRTKMGEPVHPLYQRSDAPLLPWV